MPLIIVIYEDEISEFNKVSSLTKREKEIVRLLATLKLNPNRTLFKFAFICRLYSFFYSL